MLVLGVLCIPAAFVALEKIGFSFGATGIASILAGIGFIKNKNTEDQNTETSSKSKTKGIGIALLVLGVLCFLASIAFENAAGTISILAGIGFIKNKKTEAQNTKTSSKSKTKVIGVALLVLGALCVSAAFVAYGDIGLSFGATGIAAIIAGIGFIKNKNTEDQNAETSSKSKTKGFGIALLVLGVLCIPAAFVALGDLGLSFGATVIASILAGIGFIKNK